MDEKKHREFEQTYEALVNKVYKYALFRVGTTQDAQDITSDTFLRAFRYFDSYTGSGNINAWIFGIARHVLADYFRNKQTSLPIDSLVHIPSNITALEIQAEQKWQLQQVMYMMQKLSHNRAEALTLHIFGDLSCAEVAELLQKSEEATRMLIHRAIQDLKFYLVSTEG